MSSTDGKDLFASKATWGVLIPVIFQVLEAVGLKLPDVDMQLLAEKISVVVGGLLFVYGQLKRKKPITSVAGLRLPPGGAS